MGFSGGTNSSSQSSSPWEGQQPYLTDVFSQAQQNFRSGGPEYYGGETVAPLSDVTQYGMGAMAARGAQGSQSEAAMNQYLQSALGTTGGPSSWTSQGSAGALDPSRVGGYADMFNAPVAGDQAVIRGITGDISDPARTALTGAATGGIDPAARSMISSAGSSGISDPVRSQLEATARGDYINANPHLNSTYDNAARKVTENFNDTVMPGINATFGAGGRTGSALHEMAVGDASGQLTDSLAGLSADIFGADYAAERGRQLDATGTLGGFDLAGGDQSIAAGSALGGLDLNSRGISVDAGRSLGGLDQSGDAIQLDARSRVMGDNLARTDAAFGNFFNQQGNELDFFGREAGLASSERQGAASMVPGASQLDYNNIQAMVDAGQMTDDQAQRLIDEERQRFDYYQNLPELRLLNYANIVNQNPFTQSSGGSRGMNVGLEF